MNYFKLHSFGSTIAKLASRETELANEEVRRYVRNAIENSNDPDWKERFIEGEKRYIAERMETGDPWYVERGSKKLDRLEKSPESMAREAALNGDSLYLPSQHAEGHNIPASEFTGLGLGHDAYRKLYPQFHDDRHDTDNTIRSLVRSAQHRDNTAPPPEALRMFKRLAVGSQGALVPNSVQEFAKKTDGRDMTAPQHGMAAFRQAFRGDLLQPAVDNIQSMPGGKERDKAIIDLARNDIKTQFARNSFMPAVSVPMLAAGLAAPSVVSSAAKALVGRHLRGKLSDEEKNMSEEEQNRLISERSPILSRLALSGKQTDKLTLDDASRLYNVAVPAALATAVIGPKGTVADVVGAKRFWHGTTADSGKSILQHGIDPAYGGLDGRAAWQGTKRQRMADALRKMPKDGIYPSSFDEMAKAHETLKSIPWDEVGRYGLDNTKLQYVLASPHEVAEHVQPGIKLPGYETQKLQDFFSDRKGMLLKDLGVTDAINAARGDAKSRELLKRNVDTMVKSDPEAARQFERLLASEVPHVAIDASKFLENAKGRAYVASDRGAALNYARMLNPDLSTENTQGAVRSMGDFVKAKGLAKVPALAKTYYEGLKGLYQQYHSPVSEVLVGGVMPHEQFHQRFEVDPDDVMQLGAAFRTKGRVSEKGVGNVLPSQLSQNDVSLGQILANRTRKPLDYIRGIGLHDSERLLGMNKQFLHGVGKAGLLAGIAGGVGYFGVRPIVKKLLNHGSPEGSVPELPQAEVAA